jgi:plastocyanin
VVDLTPDRPTAISERWLARAFPPLRGGAVSRKIPRLFLVASVAAGFGLIPMAGSNAADTRSVDVWDMPRGFEVPEKASKNLDIYLGDSVTWYIQEGEHTITPVNPKKWGDDGSEKRTQASDPYTANNFNTVGLYRYYCEIHGDPGTNGQPVGMWAEIDVKDPNTAPPPPPPPVETTTTTIASTTTTKPPTTQTTAPPGGSSAGALSPTTTRPAPTTTSTAKPDKNKKPPKEEETTTTTRVPAPRPRVRPSPSSSRSGAGTARSC